MAFYFQKSYRPEIEQLLRQYYQSLSEKDRRRFAALEAIKLGHGGIAYVARLLACHRRTIERGLNELRQPDSLLPPHRARKKGAADNAV